MHFKTSLSILLILVTVQAMAYTGEKSPRFEKKQPIEVSVNNDDMAPEGISESTGKKISICYILRSQKL